MDFHTLAKYLLISFRSFVFQICGLIMGLPTNKKELNQVIDSYLNSSVDGELTKGRFLAHFRAKSNTDFCEYLRGFYGERWSDSLINPVLACGYYLEDVLKKKAKNISRKSKSAEIIKYLDEQYSLPVPPASRKRPLSETECAPAPATPVEPPTRKRPATDVKSCDSPTPETPLATPVEPPTSTIPAIHVDSCDPSAPETPPATPVEPPTSTIPAIHVESCDPSAPETPPATPVEPPTSTIPAIHVESCDPSAPETPPATPSTSTCYDFITPKRSCANCFDLRQESSTLRKELNSSKSEAAKLQRRVNVKFKSEPRVLGQANKRLKAQLERQHDTHEQKYFELQFEFLELQEDFIELDTKYTQKVNRIEELGEDVDHLNNQIAKLAKQKAEIRRYHNAVKKQSVLSSQLKAAKEEIKALKTQLAYTENLLHDQDKENINTIDGNQFDAKTRKCIMYCLEKNVSQQNTSSIVKFIVREMTGKTITKLPKRTTVQNIARESSIVSNIQTGHIMSRSSNVTIAWDATVKKGTHLNEVHVNTPYGPLVLDVSELPGGKADDYKTHIQEALSDIANQYSNCYEKDPDEVKKQIHDGNYH